MSILMDQSNELYRLGSTRFWICLLLCYGYFVYGLNRVNLSMAMVCMVNNTAIAASNENSYNNNFTENKISYNGEPCILVESAAKEYEGPFYWNSYNQEIIFSGYFWGATGFGFVIGWFADRYGPKTIMTITTLMAIIATALTEVAANFGGVPAFTTLRVIAGFGYGALFPCLGATASGWFTRNEKRSAVVLGTSGLQISALVSMPVFSWFCSLKHVLNGWPLIFYSTAILAVIWTILWMIFFSNTADENRFTPESEKLFLRRHMINEKMTLNREKMTDETPWMEMLTSVPLIVLLLAAFQSIFLIGTFATYLPTYYRDVLKLDLNKNGMFSSIPNAAHLCGKLFFLFISNKIRNALDLTETTMCKIFTSITVFGSSCCIGGLLFLDCHNAYVALILLIMVFFCFGGNSTGQKTNSFLIAPAYSGIISSLNEAACNLGQLLSTYFVGSIATEGTKLQWQIIFGIIIISSLLIGVLYACFASAEMQPWASTDDFRLSSENKPKNSKSDQFLENDAENEL